MPKTVKMIRQDAPELCEHLQTLQFTWSIEHFEDLMVNIPVKSFRSSKFSVTFGSVPTQWQLKLNFHGPRNCYFLLSNSISLYLIQLRSQHCPKATAHSCSLIIKSSTNFEYTKDIRVGADLYDSEDETQWGVARFISLAYLSARKLDLVPSGTLTIVCKGEFGMVLPEDHHKESTISTHFLQLLESSEGSDALLVSAGKEIPVHRLVLQARSPVFAAMFGHDTTEKSTGIVLISDVDPTVLEAMVRFLYTDQEPPNMSEVAEDLLVAADKYDLSRLKTMCERHLSDTLDVGNVIPRLQFAISHNCEWLKEASCSFTLSNLTLMKKSVVWGKNLVEKYPDAVGEMLEHM